MTQVRRLSRALLGMFAAFTLIHCGSGNVVVHGDQTGKVAVTVNALGTPVATVTITTSGGTPAIAIPLVSNLNVASTGIATGVLELPPGQGRRVDAQAFTSDGSLAYEGSVTIDVVPGTNNPVSIPMVAKAGTVPITIQLGDASVVVTPAATSLEPGTTQHMTVLVQAADGTVIHDTTTPPQWATSNPTVVTIQVDADGQGATATAVKGGKADVIVMYAGVAGSSAVTVTGSVGGGGGGNPGGGGGGGNAGPPTAIIAAPSGAEVNKSVALDASGSSDPDGRTLTFAWTVTAKPDGAKVTLTGADTAKPSFTADAEGTYTLQVVVTAADGENASATTDVVVGKPIQPLAHRVAQAEYSHSLDKIVMTSGSPNALYVYDPATQTESSVSLPLPPQSLSVSPNGKYAVVGHNAYISYVDLVEETIVSTIPVSVDVSDCILADNGWAYVLSNSDLVNGLRSVNLATKQETGGTYGNWSGQHGRLHPDGTTMYVISSSGSPEILSRWNATAGVAKYDWLSPYWGDYSLGSKLWITADGSRLLTAAGTAFRSSSVQAQDMVYAGTLSGIGSVKHLDSTTTEIAAIPGSSYLSTTASDTQLEIFDTSYLGHQSRIALPSWSVNGKAYPIHGLFVFYSADGSKKYVIGQADSTSSLLRDTTILRF